MLRRPGGRPAPENIAARRRVADGSRSLGLRTRVLPQAIAIAPCTTGISTGKLKGLIATTTPMRANLHRVDATRHTRAKRATVPTADRGQLAQHLDSTIDLCACIGEGLAQLGNDDIDKFITSLLESTAQFEHYRRPRLHPLCGPRPKGSPG